jgi:hypothetical protein
MQEKSLICDHCNLDFLVTYRQWVNKRSAKKLNNKKHYCGKDCRYKGMRIYLPIQILCDQCGCSFVRHKSEAQKSINNFCSRSCSAIFSNKISPKKVKTKICKTCNTLIFQSKIHCPSCINLGKHTLNGQFVSDRTLAEELHNKRNDANRYSGIRSNARSFMSKKEKKCANCDYSLHVEVCHIKAITDFPLDSLIKDINSKKNLILLCRRCHWEFDNGYLKL